MLAFREVPKREGPEHCCRGQRFLGEAWGFRVWVVRRGWEQWGLGAALRGQRGSHEQGFCEETGPPAATVLLSSQAEVLPLSCRGSEPLVVLEQVRRD